MISPYQPPEPGQDSGGDRPGAGEAAPRIGCGVGGCLIPLLLFIACAITGDFGGPLFWPFIVLLSGGLGMIIGYVYRWRRK